MGINFFFTFPTSEGSDLLSSHVMQTPTFISKLSDGNVIFRLDVGKNVFPNVLKISKVIPLFKKGDKDNMNNYRPISIVPTFSKVFEYLLKKQITKFFDNNKQTKQTIVFQKPIWVQKQFVNNSSCK
jgi:hypothetical protein